MRVEPGGRPLALGEDAPAHAGTLMHAASIAAVASLRAGLAINAIDYLLPPAFSRTAA